MEIEELSWRTTNPLLVGDNNIEIKEEINLLDEKRILTTSTSTTIKQTMVFRYNWCVQPREFQIGDLVLQRINIGRENARDGELEENWKGT